MNIWFGCLASPLDLAHLSRKVWLVLAGAILALQCMQPANAANRAANSTRDLANLCSELQNADFSGVQDAPTEVTHSNWIPAVDELPAHCTVQGYVSPQVGIELKLPERWNGKFVHIGCGGFCGQTQPFPMNSVLGCGPALDKGYACIGTDMGHQGSGGVWAYHNLQAEIDFGFRATHVSTLAGKAITAYYYGHAPRKSYFTGCSTGGRQALVAAQRFPWDFDGIIAMDPALKFTETHMTQLWISMLVRDAEGRPVFSEANIRALHEAVIARCDLNDGVKDGLIGDPRDCPFDPSELSCQHGARGGCLSPDQVGVLKKIYTGPTTSTGEKLVKGGLMLGAESGLSMYLDVSREPHEFFRYLAFMPDAGAAWNRADFDFDRDYQRLGMAEALLASANPDLRQFKARGGKLLLSQGWHDSGAPFAFNTIDYYETVERTMGGRAATQEFFRMFMVPGREHCAGGNGAWVIDYLGYLEAWVERGELPELMIGHHPKDARKFVGKFPLPPENVAFTRPLYPYPLTTKYTGQGDPRRAEHYRPVERQEKP